LDAESTGEALIAVGAGQTEAQIMIADRFSVPEPFVETTFAAVQTVASGIDVN